MPRYTYECENCTRTIVLHRNIADRDNPGVTCFCGQEFKRQVEAPSFKVQGGTPKFHEKGQK